MTIWDFMDKHQILTVVLAVIATLAIAYVADAIARALKR